MGWCQYPKTTLIFIDGWMDGMRVVWAIVEKSNELFKLKWHDSNQEFFVQSKSGGGFPFREVD
ncbi:MAG: hypothetical protein QMD71_06505 [bacterium]|nr:hypothetical protein [bacterium]